MEEIVKDRILIRLLGKLSLKQRQELDEYLNCGLFNKDAQLTGLYRFIIEMIVSVRKPKVTNADLIRETGILESQINKSFSQLFKLVNQYLDLMERRARPEEGFRYLFHAYTKLGVDEKIVEKEWNKAQKIIRNLPSETENLHTEFAIAHNIGLQAVYSERRKIPEHFRLNQQLLDHYYITTRLKYLCAIRNMDKMFNQPREDLGQNEVLSLFLREKEFLPPTPVAYWRALLLMENSTELDLQLEQQIHFLKAHEKEIHFSDAVDLWGYCLNFCIMQLAYGKGEYRKITDNIYLHLLEKGYLLDEGRLSSFHFNNIIKSRLDFNEINWVADFIKEYERKLSDDFEGAIIIYAWGLWHYHSGNFVAAIHHFKQLLNFQLEDIFWNLDFRSLLWKSYFEIYEELTPAEVDEMDNLYDSFRIYVTRNDRIPEVSRHNYLTFIRYFNRLRLIVTTGQAEINQLAQLKTEIESIPTMGSKKWLLEKISNYISKISIT